MSYTLDPEQAEVHALAELIDLTGKDVLEIGCGYGRLTWRIADRARSILAIDPMGAEIERAEAARPAKLCERVTFREADITTIALPTAAFDVAIFSWSL